LICLGLALLTLALFFRASGFAFITYDDRLYVTDNPHVLSGLRWSNIAWAFTTWRAGNWHPLTWVSLMLDAELFGKSAGGYHFTNVLLHTANAVLLFLVLQQLTGHVWRSAFVAALFAIHPLHVESVAWVVERKDLLSTLFFLLALGAYRRYLARPSPARYTALILSFLLGLLSKSMLVTFPFVLLLLDFWPLDRIGDQRTEDRGQRSEVRSQSSVVSSRFLALVLEKVPLVAISAVFSVVTFLAQRSVGATMPITFYPPLARLENALLSYERYLDKIFWPHDLVLPYPFSPSLNPLELCWAAVVLITMSFIAIKTAGQRGYLLAGWFWFLGMLVPVIGLIQVGPQAMADRYMYVPAIGIFIAITWGAAEAGLKLRLPAYLNGLFACAVLFALGSLCWIQLGYWKNSETLFRHSLAVNPREFVALQQLAIEYGTQRRFPEAIACLEVLLSEKPRDAATHFRLGQALREIGEDRRAIYEYEVALAFSRNDDKHNVTSSVLNNLAWVRATSSDDNLRDGAEAVRLAERSCQLTDNPSAAQLDTLAAAYAETGDFKRATDTAIRALQLAESDNDQDLRAQISEHVDLFCRQMPYREQGKKLKN
jgi:tetratricopeptide (TPR) repeat protein